MIRPYWSDIVPLIFGDVLHNLRSALDQAFCELVLRNNGEIQKNTLFPISRGGAVDLRAMLTGQVANGSSPAPEIIATINDVVQPFRGGNGDLIVDLHELNIADKHMQPLFALSTVSIDRIRMLNGAIVEGFHFTSGNWRSYGSVRASFDDNPGLSWRVSAVLPEGRPQAGQSILEVADRLIQVVDKALFDLIDAESKRVGSNAAI